MNTELQNRKLILQNNQGQVLRTFHWSGEDFAVVNRKDTRRIELHGALDYLNAQQIPYEVLENVRAQDLEKNKVNVASLGHLQLVQELVETPKDIELEQHRQKHWYLSLLLVGMLAVLFLSVVLTSKPNLVAQQAAQNQALVKIIDKVKIQKQKTVVRTQFANQDMTVTEKPQAVAKKVDSIKRMGALAVLGSLKSGKQRGGLDLGAVNTTAGPGLGGTGGSGGAQTALYGKGLVAAPVGPGARMDGGGGYGTKGKGGGQAGYGKLSMVGSSGAQLIPVGQEATTEGGLDMGLISDVVRRNLGQIRFCYEQGLQGTPSLAGRVGVSFVISPEGQVSLANVANTTLNSKSVEECIVMRVKSWRFPIPTNGLQVKVTYPFVLNRAGQGAL